LRAAGATALTLNVPSSHPPLKVSNKTKVANLSTDWFDGLDSTSFVRRGIAQSVSVTSAGGVVGVTNTGSTNGVQGRTQSSAAAGV
jgi:hypothetical protein